MTALIALMLNLLHHALGYVAGSPSSRALPNSPDGYTPAEIACQATRPTIRSASALSQIEVTWLQRRRPKCLEAMADLFGHLNIDDFHVEWFTNRTEDELPNIGIVFSGGGYRALLNGAGAFAAFDARSDNPNFGGLQGLLQASTYVSGLSGGSWLVGSIYVSNFTTLPNRGFPHIPDQNTFVNLGLNRRPTFFGCDSADGTGNQTSPLIVYIPNAPYTYYSNVSTFDLAYDTDERDAIIMNGYNVASMGNSSLDSEWPVCLGCAVLSRSLNRTQSATPKQCQVCLERYCWNGSTNSTIPSTYEPLLLLPTSGSPWLRGRVPSKGLVYLLLVVIVDGLFIY